MSYAYRNLQNLVWLILVAAVRALETRSGTFLETDLERNRIWRQPSDTGTDGKITESFGVKVDLNHPDAFQSGSGSVEKVEFTTLDRIRRDIDDSAARGEFIRKSLSNKKSPGEAARIRPGRRVLQDSKHIWRKDETGSGRHLQSARYESQISITGGGYSMQISIGTPARTFTAFADTGSDLPWLQCKPCKSCFLQPEPIFHPATSVSYRSVQCNSTFCSQLYEGKNFAGCIPDCKYHYDYLDHTHSRGDLALETLTLSGGGGGPILRLPEFAFGCGHDNSGSLNQTGAVGIIGLGRGKLSLPSQLKPYIGSKFSTCFVNRFVAGKRTSPLFFGDMAGPSGPDVQYTPMLPSSSSFYYLHLEGISVADTYTSVNKAGHLSLFEVTDVASSVESLSSDYVRTILDSGSTLTTLVPGVYNSVIQAFHNHSPDYPRVDMSQHGLDLCFDVTDVEHPKMPDLIFHLTGATWSLPQENTVLIVRDDDGRGVLMCVALSQSKIEANVIGNIHQQDFHIVYDEDQSSIGFARVKCHTL
ncbi:hypothetical protein MPTK1_3g12890 [Marchantia polymorpha subsp. ruderalis]|uniref:Peptidase A1 domain-containing protein n=2 Tax=Marchantia polymorpha TaxID=3197 RepID=A0AAF6B080_MARPO|nr:hypothetical protein MARPO_0050s0081 [Marchantia polymorpha]BBN05414.1 hypothetical protein Mp_3g12890 [Marchantia polymorpha subsp. ruderalis]|eukprot:PTQ38627.1 hypothetical protein MARPO_0050s0081 [Marchantia polymorpha]